MPLNLDENNAIYQIRAYQPGLLQINEQKFTHSVIITPSRLIDDWSPQFFSELNAESLSIIKTLKPDILLLGTGSTMVYVPPEIYGELINAGIGVETMATQAACRTYNALSAENRNVAAALIIK